jgi:glutamate--cysteine ligase
MAFTALWVGLLYDPPARAAAWELTRAWSFARRLEFQGAVAKTALRTEGALDLARELAAIARKGLAGWAARSGLDERSYLDPLDDILVSGRTLAERALDALAKSPESLIRFWQIA